MTHSRKFRQSLLGLSALCTVAVALPVGAGSAQAQQLALNTSNTGGADIETVVITGRRFNPEVAPSKASLDTTEPQTIIGRTYIEDSVAPTADYVTVLAIVPSLTGTDINGPGLSDGSVKNTLRGLPDGDFGMSYDGIPFGDTNGPTHHSESYFPASTIGGADVERGPGNAGTLGAATFGGSIYLYSEPLTEDPSAKAELSYGSWQTFNMIGNVQTGNFDNLGFDSRLMINLQNTVGNGYLTLQNTHHDNELVKYEADIAPGWTLTFFGNSNSLHQHLSDNNGATAAQVNTFGINFALQNTNPKLATYNAYNFQNKITDMDYIRLKGEVTDSIKVDDQVYTYAYVNKTVTVSTLTQTQTDINNGVTEGMGTTTGGTYSTVGSTTLPDGNVLGGKMVGATKNPNDIPGYTKLNAYRVWGNILRASWDWAFGDVTGQLRVGLWAEGSATERQRYYFDVTQCFAAAPCNIFQTEHSGQFADSGAKKGNILNGIPGVGYLEHTSWTQYEPFAELEIHPIENLTVTPGIKYIDWQHNVAADVIAASKPPVQYMGPASFTTTRTLPFATVNYKILPYWSTYFQYAQGIYIPDITAFEQPGTVFTFPKPQTTTNYQWGMVFYGDNFSIDGDIYYIDSKNTISFFTGTLATPSCPVGDTCATNIGTATYKGIEGESTYAFGDDDFGGILSGLSIFANGSLNSAKSGGQQVKQAPFWTAASGLIYKAHNLKLSLIDKVTGQQYEDNGHVDVNGVAAGGAGYTGVSFYHLGAYNTLDFVGSYDIGPALGVDEDVEIGGAVNNILDSHKIVSMTINDSKPVGGASVNDIANRPNSLDQYYFQAARMFQVTLKVKF